MSYWIVLMNSQPNTVPPGSNSLLQTSLGLSYNSPSLLQGLLLGSESCHSLHPWWIVCQAGWRHAGTKLFSCFCRPCKLLACFTITFLATQSISDFRHQDIRSKGQQLSLERCQDCEESVFTLLESSQVSLSVSLRLVEDTTFLAQRQKS